MSWQNILKDYGDTFKKPDGSTFIEGFGYIQNLIEKIKHLLKEINRVNYCQKKNKVQNQHLLIGLILFVRIIWSII